LNILCKTQTTVLGCLPILHLLKKAASYRAVLKMYAVLLTLWNQNSLTVFRILHNMFCINCCPCKGYWL